MRNISNYAGSLLVRMAKAIIGQEHVPVGGVLDTGWPVDMLENDNGEFS